MIYNNKKYDYLKAIETGFNLYGLNGFYMMHEDVCNKEEIPWVEPWVGKLECLNDLNYEEFESLCEDYFNK